MRVSSLAAFAASPWPQSLLHLAAASGSNRGLRHSRILGAATAAATTTLTTSTENDAAFAGGDCKPVQQGTPGNKDFAVFFQRLCGSPCSPWHDLPLLEKDPTFQNSPFQPSPAVAAAAAAAAAAVTSKGRDAAFAASSLPLVQFVAEISCGSALKNEIRLQEAFNPIRQDRHKDGQPTSLVIGALALIDSGEVDYKILVVSASSPFFSALHSPTDLQILRPGFLDTVKDWFRRYKVGGAPGGPSKENTFGYGGAPLDAAAAWRMIQEAHERYVELRKNPSRASHLWLPPDTTPTGQAA
ncbi:soluble inorganic pyrophosphatase 6, chloroplastic [Cyclospora cayetanensis]|uniref:inorganic diphosphatase n=1 Tax=Cyclospora cayetanensis TaxID=88456 RepID=A0A6P6RWJ2_9EIME|nr:soluble inorganic pyrophosphatase 6, chloroplastic [Cyclospora cayetanensis]